MIFPQFCKGLYRIPIFHHFCHQFPTFFCGFQAIFRNGQDDFALVLMEDADGEVLSLTEEYPTSDRFKVRPS